MIRKDLPFLAFSLAAHAGLLVLLLLWRLPPEAEVPQRRVLLELRRPTHPGPPERGDSRVPPAVPPGRADAPPAAGRPERPRRTVPGLPVPEGGRLETPPAAGPAAWKAVPLPEVGSRLPDAPAYVPEATAAAALPTPEQLLRGLSAGTTAARPAVTAEPAGYLQTTALEWKAGGRTLLQQPRLGFPELLLEKGLEVDVEAAFVVAPNGQVVRVEITRSSGFASVDREVEQALRDALFAESSQEDTGRIQFRFRLERKQ